MFFDLSRLWFIIMTIIYILYVNYHIVLLKVLINHILHETRFIVVPCHCIFHVLLLCMCVFRYFCSCVIGKIYFYVKLCQIRIESWILNLLIPIQLVSGKLIYSHTILNLRHLNEDFAALTQMCSPHIGAYYCATVACAYLKSYLTNGRCHWVWSMILSNMHIQCCGWVW